MRYAVTQWEGKQDEVMVEFKRMRLCENYDDNEMEAEIQTLLDHIVNQIYDQESISTYIFRIFHITKMNSINSLDSYEIDDHQLAALSVIFEREYYGYITDTELVEAMDRLLAYDNNNRQEQLMDVQSPLLTQMHNDHDFHQLYCAEEDMDEFY